MMATESVPPSPQAASANATFEAHTDDVYAWAFRLLGRHHDTLDVVQDVFLRWNQQCHEETPRHARGWLRRVTVNRAIDMLRQRGSTEASRDSAAPEAVGVPRIAAAEHRELRRDIAEALGSLTDIQRTVLVAKVYDSVTFAKIAEELGVAVSTVKTHYVRAISRVSKQLQPRWAPEDLA